MPMNILILTAGWFCFSLLLMLIFFSIYSFARERQWRAFRRGLVLLVPLFIFLGVLLLDNIPFHRWIVLIVLGAVGLTGMAMTLPATVPAAIRITGDQKRVDERDAVFHRFYRIKPGMPEFEAYYRMHPEKYQADQKFRAMPGLGMPGSRTYHPLTAPFQEAIFSVLGTMTRDIDWQPQPIEDQPVKFAPEEFSRRIKGFARYLGADLVGITELNPAYVYSHNARGSGDWGAPIQLNHRYAIAIAVEMQHHMIRHAPEGPTITESAFSYYENAKIALVVARYINLLGYEARAHVDGNYRVMCIPIAVDAGLGELGRLGLLITPQFGPRVRLSVVTTNLPLHVDKPIAFGVQHFCSICKKCGENCPSGSIDMKAKAPHNGVEKWQSDQDSCYRFWRKQGTDCAICIRVCPYSYPQAPIHSLVRWLVRRNNFARRMAMLGDRFFYGRRPGVPLDFPDWHCSH